jgi:hypothetical protein
MLALLEVLNHLWRITKPLPLINIINAAPPMARPAQVQNPALFARNAAAVPHNRHAPMHKHTDIERSLAACHNSSPNKKSPDISEAGRGMKRRSIRLLIANDRNGKTMKPTAIDVKALMAIDSGRSSRWTYSSLFQAARNLFIKDITPIGFAANALNEEWPLGRLSRFRCSIFSKKVCAVYH